MLNKLYSQTVLSGLDSGSEELSALVVRQEALHLLMVRQVVEQVPALRSLQVAAALVPVQMAVAHCMVLEASILQGANHEESLLG